MKTLFFTLSIFLMLQVNAQKKPFYNTQEEIIEAAYLTLDNDLQEGGSLHEFKSKNQLQGTYSFTLTLQGKGEVVTVYVVDRAGGSIEMQNQLKNYMKGYKFPFKMPKNKRYQFNYQFKF